MLRITTFNSGKQDAFHILACKEIRISSTRLSISESADIEEESGADNGAASKGKAITQVVKKGLIQNTVPIFIELKRILESKNSPLIGSLMECLRVLLKDYKNEIDEILVADKQLQKELIYDMQKYEAAKAKATVAATMPKPSVHRSPEASSETLAKIQGQSKLKDKNENSKKVASAMADAAAAATARAVLREVNKGTGTPPLSSLGVPKVKSRTIVSCSISDRRPDVIESLRKRQSFDSDDEN